MGNLWSMESYYERVMREDREREERERERNIEYLERVMRQQEQ